MSEHLTSPSPCTSRPGSNSFQGSYHPVIGCFKPLFLMLLLLQAHRSPCTLVRAPCPWTTRQVGLPFASPRHKVCPCPGAQDVLVKLAHPYDLSSWRSAVCSPVPLRYAITSGSRPRVLVTLGARVMDTGGSPLVNIEEGFPRASALTAQVSLVLTATVWLRCCH